MKNKKILLIGGALIGIIWLFWNFNSIDKKQQEILLEIKKIKTVANNLPPPNPTSVTVQDIGKLKDKLNKLQAQIDEQNDILGLANSSSSPQLSPTQGLSINFVKISDPKWSTVDVFQNSNSSSKIIGQAVYGKSYPYTRKENSYYYIQLDNNLFGWIHSQFVKEF